MGARVRARRIPLERQRFLEQKNDLDRDGEPDKRHGVVDVLEGIVVRETARAVEVVSEDGRLRTLPKERTKFSLVVPEDGPAVNCPEFERDCW